MTVQDATWFQWTAQPNFAKHLLAARGKSQIYFLQIGVYKGDASEWMLRHVLTGEDATLVDVDPWGANAGDYHELDAIVEDWDDVFKEYRDRVSQYQGHIATHKLTSNQYFKALDPRIAFDFIYVDGAHDAVSTIEDGVNAYRHLKLHGLIAFDDYTYGETEDEPNQNPALAIDSIRSIYKNRLSLIALNHQAWFIKVA